MVVKICGITRLADAEAAVEAGASALGFVFWPKSPRFIDPHRARAIAASLPPFVVPVGVFVNQPAAHVKGVAALVGLGAVQLHGDEDVCVRGEHPVPDDQGRDVSETDASADRIDIWPRPTTLLLDVHDPVSRGGTGRTIDWPAAAPIAGEAPDAAGRRADARQRRRRHRPRAALRHRRVVGRRASRPE